MTKMKNRGNAEKNAMPKTTRFLFNGKPLKGEKGQSFAQALTACGVKIFGYGRQSGAPAGVGADRLTSGFLSLPSLSGKDSETEIRAFADDVAIEEDRETRPFGKPGFFDKIKKLSLSHLFVAKQNGESGGPLVTMFDKITERLTEKNNHDENAAFIKSYIHADLLVAGDDPCGIFAASVAASAGLRTVICAAHGDRAFNRDMSEAEKEARAFLETCERCLFLDAHEILPVSDKNNDRTGGFTHIAAEMRPYRDISRAAYPPLDFKVIKSEFTLYALGVKEITPLFPGCQNPGIAPSEFALKAFSSETLSPFKKIVFIINNDKAYQGVAACMAAGTPPAAVYDIREKMTTVAKETEKAGIPVFCGYAPVSAGAETVTLSSIGVSHEAGDKVQEYDFLFISGGHRADTDMFRYCPALLTFEEGADFPTFNLGKAAQNGARIIGAALHHGSEKTAYAEALKAVTEILEKKSLTATFHPPEPETEEVPVLPARKFAVFGSYAEKGVLTPDLYFSELRRMIKSGNIEEFIDKLFTFQPEILKIIRQDLNALYRCLNAFALVTPGGKTVNRKEALEKILQSEKYGRSVLSVIRVLEETRLFKQRKTPLYPLYFRHKIKTAPNISDVCPPLAFPSEAENGENALKETLASCGLTDQSGRPIFFVRGADAANFFAKEADLGAKLPAPGEVLPISLRSPFETQKHSGLLSREANGDFTFIGEYQDRLKLTRVFKDAENHFERFAPADMTEQYAVLTLIGENAFHAINNLPDLNKRPPITEDRYFSFWYQHVPLQISALEMFERPTIWLLTPAGYAEAVANRLIAENAPVSVTPFGYEAFRALLQTADKTENGVFKNTTPEKAAESKETVKPETVKPTVEPEKEKAETL